MNVKDRLQNVFRMVFDDNSINIFEDMTADDIEEWDSLMHIQLIIAIEAEFRVNFSTHEIVQIGTVGEFIDLISKKVG